MGDIKFGPSQRKLPTPWIIERIFDGVLAVCIAIQGYLTMVNTIDDHTKEITGLILVIVIAISRYGMGMFSQISKLESAKNQIVETQEQIKTVIAAAEVKQEEIKEVIKTAEADQVAAKKP